MLCLTSAVAKVFAIKLKGKFQNSDNTSQDGTESDEQYIKEASQRVPSLTWVIMCVPAYVPQEDIDSNLQAKILTLKLLIGDISNTDQNVECI